MLKFHNDEYEIDVATTGDECFDKLLNNNYNLVLLDQEIDGGKGIDILKKINKSGFDITVIMMVEEGKENIAFKSLEQGASDYIMKVRGYLTALPFTVGKVLERKKNNKPKEEKDVVEEKPPVPVKKKAPVQQGSYFLVDRQGRFMSSHKLLEGITEYSEAELLELTIPDLLPNKYATAYTQWLSRINLGYTKDNISVEIVGKMGKRRSVAFSFLPVRDKNSVITSYKVKIAPVKEAVLTDKFSENTVLQNQMIKEMVEITNSSHNGSLNHLLERITQTICQLFQFKRATLALLDRRRKVFVKLIMVGYTTTNENDSRILEVPQEVIDRAFNSTRRIKVLYFDQNASMNQNALVDTMASERRTQERRSNGKWHPNDMIILNLIDKHQQTFGYISLANPEFETMPSREIFHNLELFSRLASLAIETYYRVATTEKSNRRLKQLLITSNIFKLHLNLNDMLGEVVWSIKFSLDFNLVMLGLISKKSGKLEMKAVACDDKIKSLQLKELDFSVESFKRIFKRQYRRGKSYFIYNEEPVLQDMKNIYYNTRIEAEGDRYWPWYSLLVVPIRRRKNRIVGFLIVDDPADCLIPSKENIHTLEILATQVSVAIDNRLTFLQASERAGAPGEQVSGELEDENADSGLKKLVDKVFKN